MKPIRLVLVLGVTHLSLTLIQMTCNTLPLAHTLHRELNLLCEVGSATARGFF